LQFPLLSLVYVWLIKPETVFAEKGFNSKRIRAKGSELPFPAKYPLFPAYSRIDMCGKSE
jgi:hypothetical protein